MSEKRHEIEVRRKNGWLIYQSPSIWDVRTTSSKRYQSWHRIALLRKSETLQGWRGQKDLYRTSLKQPQVVPLSRYGSLPSICGKAFS